jgi:hypothetical protein
MPLQFTKEEVEQELSDCLRHGRREDVARVSGLGLSYIKRQFNPDDETPSCAFKLLQIACALDEIDEVEGEEFWEALCRFRELSKVRKLHRSLNQEAGKLNKEIGEFVAARLENKPFLEQMSELLDARRQLDTVQETLIAEFNVSKEVPGILRSVKIA